MAIHLKKTSKASGTSTAPQPNVSAIVEGVIDDIRASGDAAVKKYSEKFDRWSPTSFKLTKAEIDASVAQLPKQVLEDIKTVQHNVRKFALAQLASLKEFEVEIAPGIHLGQKNIPIQAVGA